MSEDYGKRALTAANGRAETALHAAAWAGDLEQVRALLASGVDPNVTDSIDETPLFGAAAWGRADVVACLLAAGARHDLHEATAGLTPLHWAASHGNLETLHILIEAGAVTTALDHHGLMPVDLAHLHGKGAHVAFLKTVGPPIASKRKST
jgi:uncharacterized protein